MSDTSLLVFMTWFFKSLVSMIVFVLKGIYLVVKTIVKAVVWIGKKLYHLGDSKDESGQAEIEYID